MQKHIQLNKDERRHFFRKIYLSLYWKGCVWEGVRDWTELQHIDPHSNGHNSVSFPFSWAAQPGGGPSLSGTWSSFQQLLSNWLTSCVHPGYIIVRRSPSSCERHNFALNSTHPRSRLYPDIPRPDAPVIYTGAFPILTAWLGRRSIYNSFTYNFEKSPSHTKYCSKKWNQSLNSY